MKKFTLDPLGQFTAANVRENKPCSFLITAHLKERIDPSILQQAVNDVLGCRLPFLSTRMRPGFFWYSQEFIPPPKIVPASVPHRFEYYYGQGRGHTLRVLYGERHFTVENIHSNVDGRGLMKVTQTLLVRYFELLGVALNKTGMIDCDAETHPEEAESGYARFYNPKKKLPKSLAGRPPAFIMEPKPGAATQVVSQNFDLSKMKQVAKEHGCTISEYMMTHMFLALAEQRSKTDNKLPIAAMLPVDCRSFFPTRSLRNFVYSQTITMPETDDFSQMLAGLRPQFAAINTEFIQSAVNEMQGLVNKTGWVPFAFKKALLRYMENRESRGITTVFSNLGKMQLPPEIEQQLECLEFVIDLEATSSCFSCVTAGEVLTLTVSVASDEAQQLARDTIQRLT